MKNPEDQCIVMCITFMVKLYSVIAVMMKSARKDEDPEKKIRGPGGKLALWAFWLFCLHFIWSLAQIVWTANRSAAIPAGVLFDAEPGQWILALLSLLTFGTVGLILGGIAWYTRPRGTNA